MRMKWVSLTPSLTPLHTPSSQPWPPSTRKETPTSRGTMLMLVGDEVGGVVGWVMGDVVLGVVWCLVWRVVCFVSGCFRSLTTITISL